MGETKEKNKIPEVAYEKHAVEQESPALASMARDDPPASSTASSTAAAMRGKVGSEFET